MNRTDRRKASFKDILRFTAGESVHMANESLAFSRSAMRVSLFALLIALGDLAFHFWK